MVGCLGVFLIGDVEYGFVLESVLSLSEFGARLRRGPAGRGRVGCVHVVADRDTSTSGL